MSIQTPNLCQAFIWEKTKEELDTIQIHKYPQQNGGDSKGYMLYGSIDITF